MGSTPFEITREDLLRSKTVSPGWYPVLVKTVVKGEAKTDGSTKWDIKLVIIEGPFKDVPIPHTISEKAPGFGVSFVEATARKKVDPEKGGQFMLENAAGKKIWAYVKNDMYQNRLTNKAADFRPYEEGETQPRM